MSVCRSCGEPIEWRVSQKGRKYPVNAAGSSGVTGQFHSTSCPARKRSTEASGAESHATVIDAASSGAGEPIARPVIAEPRFEHESGDDLATIIAQHVAGLVKMPKQAPVVASIDEDAVRAIVASELAASGGQWIIVSVRGSDAAPIDVGRQHEAFPLLLAIVARRRNVWLVGPAGTGKTSGAHKAADALGLAFGAVSVGPQTTQSAIFGYMDAHGKYVETEFRRRFEHGGVFLFDEIDRGNPGVLTALNQAIENGACAFPDSMVKRHPDAVFIAAANTYGNGASREYVGALQIDAATLDRFVMIEWNVDEAFELELTLATYAAAGGKSTTDARNWLDKVRHARRKAAELKLRHIVSPRASIVGADLLASGIAEDVVAKLVLWKGADADTIARLS